MNVQSGSSIFDHFIEQLELNTNNNNTENVNFQVVQSLWFIGREHTYIIQFIGMRSHDRGGQFTGKITRIHALTEYLTDSVLLNLQAFFCRKSINGEMVEHAEHKSFVTRNSAPNFKITPLKTLFLYMHTSVLLYNIVCKFIAKKIIYV